MQNYNFTQKFLHDLVFKNMFINKSLFEIEKIFYLKKDNTADNSHIFITGLPRSGTTILLNFIYSSGEFASLKYSNMPFIFSPNISKLFNKKNIAKKERLHGDGIYYDLDSPEAFDEIFLSQRESYIKDELINYIKLILVSQNKKRYLSKNNLNYKRVKLLSSILPNSIFLIPVREPFYHALSLFNQHLHFSKLQKDNDFVRRYMNYLGHNEFGLNHKPWNNPKYFKDPNNFNYWLEQWLLFYNRVKKDYEFQKNCLFVIYENMNSPSYMNTLLTNVNFENKEKLNLNLFKNSNKKKTDIKFDSDTYNEACKIYKSF